MPPSSPNGTRTGMRKTIASFLGLTVILFVFILISSTNALENDSTQERFMMKERSKSFSFDHFKKTIPFTRGRKTLYQVNPDQKEDENLTQAHGDGNDKSPLSASFITTNEKRAKSGGSSRKTRVETQTPLGTLIGDVGESELGTRWSVRYATVPKRFAKSEIVTSFDDGNFDGTQRPPACPQDPDQFPGGQAAMTNGMDEDCLWLNIFVPKKVTTQDLPVFVWVHGGSLLAGSSTAPGLSGHSLAHSTQSIVVTIQYRLGLLGFLRLPSASSSSNPIPGNLALQDILTSLRFLSNILPAFGSAKKPEITLAGQSSGANLINTLLLAVPAAARSDVFAKAIMHSPVLDQPDQTVEVAEAIGEAFLRGANCSTNNDPVGCLQSLAPDDFIQLQTQLQDVLAQGIEGWTSAQSPFGLDLTDLVGAGGATQTLVSVPFGVVVDGELVKEQWGRVVERNDGGSGGKPVVITTVRNEACATVEDVFSSPIPTSVFPAAVQQFLSPPDERAQAVLDSNLYDPNSLVKSDPAEINETDKVRDALELLGTDYQWRCAVQQSAVNLTAGRRQKNIWLGQFNVGIPYPELSSPYCDDKVAHQDDIPLLFAAGPLLPTTPSQQAVSLELVTRWSSFLHTSNPNPSPSFLSNLLQFLSPFLDSLSQDVRHLLSGTLNLHLTRDKWIRGTFAISSRVFRSTAPSPSTYVSWEPVANSGDLNLLVFGGKNGSSLVAEVVNNQRPNECQVGKGIWGSGEVLFDEQLVG